jgi:transposase
VSSRHRRYGALVEWLQGHGELNRVIVTGPPRLREQLRHLPTLKLIAACAQLRPGHQLGDTEHATKTALRRLARRHQQLSAEITEADQELHQLVHEVAPALLALPGVGPEVAGQVLISAGDNLDRIKSEAAFAHLCGAAPIPASSGHTHRHRLNRGSDRGANNALYVVVVGRLRYDPRTRAYAERRTHEGLSKPEIIRCLKRYVAREIFNALPILVAENHAAVIEQMRLSCCTLVDPLPGPPSFQATGVCPMEPLALPWLDCG